MSNFILKASKGGAWASFGFSNSPLSFGSFGGASSNDNTNRIGVALPFNSVLQQYSVALTESGGSALTTAVQAGITLDGTVITPTFPYPSGFTAMLNPYPDFPFTTGTMLNFTFDPSGGVSPPGIVSSTAMAVLEIQDQLFDKLSIELVVGEQSVPNTDPLSGRIAFGSGANNAPQSDQGGFITMPVNSTLVAISFSAKNGNAGSITAPTGNVVANVLKIAGGVGAPTIEASGTILSGQFSTTTILGAPVSFLQGDGVTVDIPSTTDANTLIAALWFSQL